MKKIRLTANGKIFFGILVLVLIVIFLTSYQKIPTQITTYVYCTPDCAPRSFPIGTTTLIRGCYINQTECLIANSSQVTVSASNLKIGIKKSTNKVPGIGTITMLNLNITQIYIRESNQSSWIPLLTKPKIFDIASLSNQTAVIGDIGPNAGNYTQEKIILGHGNITIYSLIFNIYNRTYDINPGTNATVLNYTFSTTLDLTQTTFLVFDLSTEKSIKHTADGYFLYPEFLVSSSTFTGNQPENSVFIS